MKVLHILHDSLPILSGYAIRSASIAKWQAAAGMEPTIVTSPQHEGPADGPAAVIDGITYYRAKRKAYPKVPFLREAKMVRQFAGEICELAERIRPDILHAHSPCLWGEAVARASRLSKLPAVYEVRGFWEEAAVDIGKIRPTSLRYRLTRGLETRVMRLVDQVVVIAEGLKTDIEGRGIPTEKIAVVRNGVDVDGFAPRSPDTELQHRYGTLGKTCIGYIGTLHPWEGVIDLLDAVPTIVAKCQNIKVLIVGTGSQSTLIRERIAAMGLGDTVEFVGEVPHRDITRYYSVMDILVYPRRSTRNTETVTPLKPLEAMAMGKAVIGSNVGGIRELIPESTGLTFRAQDVEDLARKCIQFVQSPDLRTQLGDSARLYTIEHRSWKRLVQSYHEIYGRALGHHAAKRKSS